MNFYLSNGNKIDNLEKYIKDYIINNPDVLIYIGTDSQRKKKGKFIYITTICFRHPGNGVHIIHHRRVVKYTKDMFTKLWNEVEYTLEAANLVKDFVDKKIITVDLDLNNLKKFGSNVAHDAAKGYLYGLGFEVRTKPDAWAATRASDHLSRRS